MFERSYLQRLIGRLEEPRRFIQVIMGPRQVGKTTLVTQATKQIEIPSTFHSADAIQASQKGWLRLVWEAARLQMEQMAVSEYLLVIDEIQKIDNWSETVKQLWDEDTRDQRGLKVILLGSSRLLLQQGLTESLAGRFENTYLGHWSLQEMQDAFGWSVEEYTWFGGYPGSAALIDDEERWKRYVSHSLIETSISKDILMLTRVDKPALLKRLFEMGCLYTGKILSFTKILGQLQDAGNTTTLSHYLDLLNTAGLLGGIEKYAADEARKRSSSPKFQVHNNALVSSQRNEVFKEIRAQPAAWDHVVESAVGAHLVNHSFSEGYKLYYWRHRNEEVDFVLERRGKIICLEVKSNDEHAAPGIDAFEKEFGVHKSFLIGNRGLPWQEFLSMDPVTLF